MYMWEGKKVFYWRTLPKNFMFLEHNFFKIFLDHLSSEINTV
jgi:hypothetical protein